MPTLPAATAIADAGLAADPKALKNLRAYAAKDPQGALKDVAREFETLFLDMMMKSMRTAAAGHSMLDNEGSRVFTGLLDHEFSRKLADQGGLGLADLLLKQLSQLAPKTPEADISEVKKSPNLPIRRA
jgi:peptidoglycan hydrolase FlgJ